MTQSELSGQSQPEPIRWISKNLFDGQMLKMSEVSNAIVVFMTRQEYCELCLDMKKELGTTWFLQMAQSWQEQGLLKFGKVKCWKNEELCRDFGISGDEESARGYPHIIHFKSGRQVGVVNERTAVELSKWVSEKQRLGEL